MKAKETKPKNVLFIILLYVPVTWLLFNLFDVRLSEKPPLYYFMALAVAGVIILLFIDYVLRRTYIIDLLRLLASRKNQLKYLSKNNTCHDAVYTTVHQTRENIRITKEINKVPNYVLKASIGFYASIFKELRSKNPYTPIDYSAAKARYEEYMSLDNKVPEFSEMIITLQQSDKEIFITKFRSEHNAAHKGKRSGQYYFLYDFGLSSQAAVEKNLVMQPVKTEVYQLLAEKDHNGNYTDRIDLVPLSQCKEDGYYDRGYYDDHYRGCYRMATENEIAAYVENRDKINKLDKEKRALQEEYNEKIEKLDKQMREMFYACRID